MAAPPWYKLDNVGKFYAAQAGNATQTVFRLSAEMTDEVDPHYLQEALASAVQHYPSFNVELRSGFFWHYLEQAQSVPTVSKEELLPCARIHEGRTSTLFRVSYFEKRVNFEASHMISDGRGSLQFFKALLGYYIEARYGVRDAVEKAWESKCSEGREADSEDSFSAHYERDKAASTSLPKAAHIKGACDRTQPLYLEYHLSASQVHAKAKEAEVSVTSLLIAAIISALGKEAGAHKRQLNRYICLTVPVDLRDIFGSVTLRNFFGLSYASYPVEQSQGPLEEIAQSVQAQIVQAVKPDMIKRRMNRMVKLEKSPFLRFAPVFLKDAALNFADLVSARDVTSAFSNLGIIKMPPAATPYIRAMNVMTSTSSLNFTACTYGDDLSLSISTILTDHAFVWTLIEKLDSLGLHGQLNASRSITPKENAPTPMKVHYPFPDLPILHQSKTAKRVLFGVMLAVMAAVIVLCIYVGSSAWNIVLACIAVVLNYVFVRNIMMHAPDFLRSVQRYLLVIVAMALLWFMATGDTQVSTFVAPTACAMASLFDIAILTTFRSKFIVGYAKYILFAIVLAIIPLVLLALGCVSWDPMVWLSSLCAAALIIVVLVEGRASMASELKKMTQN